MKTLRAKTKLKSQLSRLTQTVTKSICLTITIQLRKMPQRQTDLGTTQPQSKNLRFSKKVETQSLMQIIWVQILEFTRCEELSVEAVETVDLLLSQSLRSIVAVVVGITALKTPQTHPQVKSLTMNESTVTIAVSCHSK